MRLVCVALVVLVACTDNSHVITPTTGTSGGSTSGSFGGGHLGGDNESTDAYALGTFDSLTFAASADGTNLAIAVSDAGVQWIHYVPESGWTAAAALPGVAHVASTPLVAMDASGDAIVAYLATTLMAMRYDHATNSWSTPLALDTTGLAIATALSLAVNASGDALIVYEHANGAVIAETYAAKAWSAVTIAPSDGQRTSGQTIARLADSGRALAAYASNGQWSVQTRSGTTWSLATNVLQATAIDAAVNDDGAAIVGFDDSSTHLPTVYAFDGAKWSAPLVLNQLAESASACAPAVSIAVTGDALFARCYSAPGVAPVAQLYARLAGQATWSATTQNVPVARWFSSLSVAFDGAGKALAVYLDAPTSAAAPASPVLSVFDGSSWSSESAAITTETTSAVRAVLTPNDRGWALWQTSGVWTVEKVE